MSIRLNKAIGVLLLLAIAGCTQTETNIPVTKPSKGLAVINFTSNFNTLRINEATNIKLLFHNYGDFDARNVTSILYGEGLLERSNEKNFSISIYQGKEDAHFWTLKAPLKLSQTESTTYVVSSRIYYYYNFSGTTQVAFVSPSYSGGEIPLSKTSLKSPLSVHFKARNPIRTLPQDNTSPGTMFTTTITISNDGVGNVDYFGCSSIQGCNKGSHLNSLRIKVPKDWTPVTNLDQWNKEEKGDEIEYSIYYDNLIENYNANSCSDSQTPACDNIRKALNDLRMVRGSEARIILQFAKDKVNDTTIDPISVSGDFGYEVDASDFTNRLPILVLGD